MPFDRTEKSALYASAGVPEYWFVDLADRQVEVRTKPAQGRYTRSQLFGSGESIPVPRSTRRLRVSDFLSARRPS
ncbi:MAG: Uma2 family endonuclease [Myxococcota bacterium]